MARTWLFGTCHPCLGCRRDLSRGALVRTVTSEMSQVVSEGAPQVPLTLGEGVVQAFTPHTPEEPFAHGVLSLGPPGRLEFHRQGEGWDSPDLATLAIPPGLRTPEWSVPGSWVDAPGCRDISR
jgi:hypothetical protein